MFFWQIAFILKAVFFIYVGLSIQVTDLRAVLIGMALTTAIFVVRIPAVRFSIRNSASMFETSLMAVMIPKGIAAAVLATVALQNGIAGGELIQNHGRPINR